MGVCQPSCGAERNSRAPRRINRTRFPDWHGASSYSQFERIPTSRIADSMASRARASHEDKRSDPAKNHRNAGCTEVSAWAAAGKILHTKKMRGEDEGIDERFRRCMKGGGVTVAAFSASSSQAKGSFPLLFHKAAGYRSYRLHTDRHLPGFAGITRPSD